MMMRIKKDDTVTVLSGKDKGRRGQVLAIDPTSDSLIVKGVAVVTKHKKARKTGEVSKIQKQETSIPLARVMPVCPACDKPCRTVSVVEGERRARACHRCRKSF